MIVGFICASPIIQKIIGIDYNVCRTAEVLYDCILPASIYACGCCVMKSSSSTVSAARSDSPPDSTTQISGRNYSAPRHPSDFSLTLCRTVTRSLPGRLPLFRVRAAYNVKELDFFTQRDSMPKCGLLIPYLSISRILAYGCWWM